MASKIIFSADAGQFTGPIKVSIQEIRVMQQELKKAEQTTKQTFGEARLQAQAGVISINQLAEAEKRYGRELLSVARTRSQLTEQFSSSGRKEVASEDAKLRAIQATNAALRQQRAETASIPTVADHYTPSRQQQASAILRGASGTPSIRAAESFASTIPGFSSLAGVAFPVVGAIALTTEVLKGVEAFRKMREEAQQAGEKLRDSFRAANAPIEQTIDTLRKSNAELEISIARLEKRPANTLALATADASLEMDRLADRAHKAYLETKKVFEESKRGFLATIYGGATGNQGLDASLAKNVLARERKIDDLRDADKDAVRSGSDNPQAAAARAAEIAKQRNDLKAFLASAKAERSGDIDETSFLTSNKTGRRVKYSDEFGSQEQNLDFIKGSQRGLNNEDDEDTERKRQDADQITQKRIESQKAMAAASAEAARKAVEAQRKAMEQQREQWATEFSEWSAATTRSASEISYYWLRKEAEAATGSRNYMEAVRNSNAAVREMNRETQRLDKENTHILNEMQMDSEKRVNKAYDQEYAALGGGGLAFVTALQSQVKAQKDGNDALAEAQIQRGVETGQLSKTAAAYQLATIHAEAYARATDAINQKREGIGDNDPNRDEKLKLLDTEQTKLDAANAVTVFQDAARLSATSWRDSFRNANALFIQDSQDTAKQVSEIYGSVISGLNSDVVKAFSEVGERGHHIGRDLGNAVGGTLRGVGSQVADIGLRRLESTGLSALGLGGKPDGTRGNPMNVFVTNGVDGKDPASAAATSAVRSMVSGSDIGGVAKSFATSALSFLPGGSLLTGIFGGARAMGGGVEPGRTYLVGEHGPELATFGATGFITPNHRIGTGGETHHHWNIDARGSNDPAAVKMLVRQGIMEAAPHIIAAGGKQHSERNLRLPRGAR